MAAPEGAENDRPPSEKAAGGAVPPAAEPAPVAEPSEEWAVRYRYLLAEFDNYRKRVEREQATLRRESRSLVLKELLPLHDAFDRAEDAVRKMPEDDPFRRGMELLFREWERFLLTEKVQPVAREGERFRAEEEEAVGELPADEAHPPGSVAQIVQQGFRGSGGLLRPAKVLIARALVEPRSTDSSKPETPLDDAGPSAAQD